RMPDRGVVDGDRLDHIAIYFRAVAGAAISSADSSDLNSMVSTASAGGTAITTCCVVTSPVTASTAASSPSLLFRQSSWLPDAHQPNRSPAKSSDAKAVMDQITPRRQRTAPSHQSPSACTRDAIPRLNVTSPKR